MMEKIWFILSLVVVIGYILYRKKLKQMKDQFKFTSIPKNNTGIYETGLNKAYIDNYGNCTLYERLQRLIQIRCTVVMYLRIYYIIHLIIVLIYEIQFLKGNYHFSGVSNYANSPLLQWLVHTITRTCSDKTHCEGIKPCIEIL